MTQRFIQASLVVAAVLVTSLQMASACSIVVPDNWGPADSQAAARDAVDGAAAVIDGEVIRPFIRGRQTALVRAVRVLKGPEKVEFEVGERDTCDMALESIGERRRMLLVGGPSVFFLPVSASEPQYEDELLGSDRQKVWPYRKGY